LSIPKPVRALIGTMASSAGARSATLAMIGSTSFLLAKVSILFKARIAGTPGGRSFSTWSSAAVQPLTWATMIATSAFWAVDWAVRLRSWFIGFSWRVW
jgi:hypothetical protein